jgi:hypothetical protein
MSISIRNDSYARFLIGDGITAAESISIVNVVTGKRVNVGRNADNSWYGVFNKRGGIYQITIIVNGITFYANFTVTLYDEIGLYMGNFYNWVIPHGYSPIP